MLVPPQSVAPDNETLVQVEPDAANALPIISTDWSTESGAADSAEPAVTTTTQVSISDLPVSTEASFTFNVSGHTACFCSVRKFLYRCVQCTSFNIMWA